MNHFCKNIFYNFFRCGITGWCMEICFTALGALPGKNRELTGHTSLWMFPIYGCAAFLAPVSRLAAAGKTYHTVIRFDGREG